MPDKTEGQAAPKLTLDDVVHKLIDSADWTAIEKHRHHLIVKGEDPGPEPVVTPEQAERAALEARLAELNAAGTA
jgi:hypothetical protein